VTVLTLDDVVYRNVIVTQSWKCMSYSVYVHP